MFTYNSNSNLFSLVLQASWLMAFVNAEAIVAMKNVAELAHKVIITPAASASALPPLQKRHSHFPPVNAL